jgi:hypothetical protein
MPCRQATPEMAVSGVTHLKCEWPVACGLFYPFGHPMPYAYVMSEFDVDASGISGGRQFWFHLITLIQVSKATINALEGVVKKT